MAKQNRRRRDVLAVTQTGLAVSGHPLLAAALKLAGEAAGRIRDNRVRKMWKHVVEGMDDPVEFTERVAQQLLDDGDLFSEGFVAAAQAAADAVAPVAVASIGLLARGFLTEQTPSRRVYRSILNILRTVDSAEYGQLRDAMHALSKLSDDDEPAGTLLVERDGEWAWLGTRTGTDRVVLMRGPDTPILVAALSPLAEPPPGADPEISDPRNRPRFHPSLVAIFTSVMPRP